MRKCAEVLMKIWRNLEKSFRKLGRKFDSRKSRVIFFLQWYFGNGSESSSARGRSRILFGVPANTIIASKTRTHLKSTPSDTVPIELMYKTAVNLL